MLWWGCASPRGVSARPVKDPSSTDLKRGRNAATCASPTTSRPHWFLAKYLCSFCGACRRIQAHEGRGNEVRRQPVCGDNLVKWDGPGEDCGAVASILARLVVLSQSLASFDCLLHRCFIPSATNWAWRPNCPFTSMLACKDSSHDQSYPRVAVLNWRAKKNANGLTHLVIDVVTHLYGAK